MSLLAERVLLLHRSLHRSRIPHAFGGALALAYCTQQARGTIDIDLNVFLDAEQVSRLRAALPEGLRISAASARQLETQGQARVLWDKIPVDFFLSTTEFHHQVAARVAWHRFGGKEVPFLACNDLAVFKAFFSRTKDWADLEEMLHVGLLDTPTVCSALAEYLGPDDERITRLRNLPG